MVTARQRYIVELSSCPECPFWTIRARLTRMVAFVHNSRRIIATAIPASAWAYWLSHISWMPVASLVLFASIVALVGFLVLPVVWSGKAYRRNAAYRLVQLILRLRR